MSMDDIRQSLHSLYGVTPSMVFGPNWRDLVIERRQFTLQRAYGGYPGEEEYAIAYVLEWFLRFYNRFASHIVTAEAYEKIVSSIIDGRFNVYGVRLMIRGTRAELAEIEKAVNESLR